MVFIYEILDKDPCGSIVLLCSARSGSDSAVLSQVWRQNLHCIDSSGSKSGSQSIAGYLPANQHDKTLLLQFWVKTKSYHIEKVKD